MNISASFWTLTGLALSALIYPGSAALADDTEIYVGGNLSSNAAVRPNVTFIIDTSGSMDTHDVKGPSEPWDPTKTWSGSCDPTRIYWSSTGTPPTDCNTSRYFNAGMNTCADASSALGNIAGASGFYEGTLARYRSRRSGDFWTSFSRNVHNDYVECKADFGKHGNGTDATKLYPANQNNGGPWTGSANNAINWNGTGGNYSLYSANYLNWYYATGGGGTITCPVGQNTAGCLQRLQVVKDAFTSLMNSTSGINASLMRYSQNGSGGYFVSPMQELTGTTRSTLINAVNSFTPSGDTPLSETLYESSLFYRGKSVLFGNSSTPGTNVAGVLDSSNASKYKSPMEYQCQKNFVVVLTDGAPTNDTQADSQIQSLPGFSTITGSKTCNGDCLDELAQWMNNYDFSSSLNDKQNVTTYTIGLNLNVPLLSDTAKKGGGKFFTINNASDLTNAFTSIITEVLAVNTTFIAPAVTVNAFNRLSHRDDMYFSVFLPGGSPDWRGNVKHYKLAGNPAIIVDANNAAAIDANTGFFSGTSTSIWTLSADAPDGNDVSKGGAAGLLGTSRNLFTYTASATPNNEALSTNPADAFNENNTALTSALLGMPATATATDLSNLIKWARGVDILDANENGVTTDARRQLGDILHSKPVLMTYGGTNANPDITLFVGDNEGFIHAINATDGSEQFGFIPKELLGNLNTLFTNPASISHPYGMDGPLSIWHKDLNGDHLVLDSSGNVQTGESVYLYAGMRRGGDNYYALDVSDRSKPVYKWQITGGSGDFAELGETWSRPTVSKIKLNGVDRNVLIFGGGYDTNQDTATTAPSADNIGRAIYIVDANTGQRLWWASSDTNADLVLPKMVNSIPSDISVLDLNNDGYADRLYVGDMGGRVWRVDINNSNSGVTDLASGGLLAELAGTDAANNRRFYYPPDVALIKTNGGYALTVSIGSGYRAHPLDKTVTDRFYMIRDNNAFNVPPDNNADGIPDYPDYTEANLYDATANNLGQANGATLSAAQTAFNSAHGWYIRLLAADGSKQGEKVLASSVTLQGQVSFTTFTPVATSQTNSCVPSSGTGQSYVVNLADATPAYDFVADGVYKVEDRAEVLKRTGIPPEPTIIFTPDAQTIECVGTECNQLNPKGMLKKSYWRQDF